MAISAEGTAAFAYPRTIRRGTPPKVELIDPDGRARAVRVPGDWLVGVEWSVGGDRALVLSKTEDEKQHYAATVAAADLSVTTHVETGDMLRAPCSLVSSDDFLVLAGKHELRSVETGRTVLSWHGGRAPDFDWDAIRK